MKEQCFLLQSPSFVCLGVTFNFVFSIFLVHTPSHSLNLNSSYIVCAL